MSKWDTYKQVNDRLKKDFFCLPPYKFTHKDIADFSSLTGEKLVAKISGIIGMPAQRAHQMEYRYKYCPIFQKAMSVIEYATFNLYSGEFICSYLALLPTIEGIFYQWVAENPSLSFIYQSNPKNDSVKAFVSSLKAFMDKSEFYTDDRAVITDSIRDYLIGVLIEVLYARGPKYKEKNIPFIFNRNLSLHELAGIEDEIVCIKNIQRLFLILDIIAELYLWMNPEKMREAWCQAEFYGTHAVDVNLRKQLYLKRIALSIWRDDLNIVRNALLGNASEEAKILQTAKLKLETDFINNQPYPNHNKS